jgi:hypothetical protein
VAVQPSIRTTTPEVTPKRSSRAERALELYRTRGREITRLSTNVYRVPSQDGQCSYDVRYDEREECPCLDHQYRGVACVHLLAVGILRAKRRGATLRSLAALEDDLRHADLGIEARRELRELVLRLRRRLGQRSLG